MSGSLPPAHSTSVESLDAASPSAPPPGTRQRVYFPPAARIDFVVHYGPTDFHCHTFVLHVHSAYFRHVFDALTPSAPTLMLPPPSLSPLADGAASGHAEPALDLSPVATPTSSPRSPPQPVWRSVLSSASSYLHSALQRLTTHAEHNRAKRKRRSQRAEADDEHQTGTTEQSSTTKRRSHSPAHAASTTSSSSDPPSSACSFPASTSASMPAPCNHPGLSCVHVPPQRTVISGEQITDADFDLFLRHLYFAAHYQYPPFLPATDLDLSTTPPPDTTLPPYAPLTEQMTSALLRTRSPPAASASPSASPASVKVVWKESLLTLAQYFVCEALLVRCEAVGVRRLERVQHAGSYFDVLYAQQYGLKEWKRRCIELILTDRRMRLRKEYALTVLWGRQLLLDILVVANARLQEIGSDEKGTQDWDKAELMRAVERAVKELHAT